MDSVWGEADKCPTVAAADGALLSLAAGAPPVPGPPTQEPPTDPNPDAPPKLRASFWLLVLLLNLAIGALAVGLMLVGFRGQWETGGALVLVGTGGLALAYLRFRTVRHKLDQGELTDDGGELNDDDRDPDGREDAD
jgi:hypothetical protein